MARPSGLRPHGKTSHEATRRNNRRLVLQSIFDDGPVSRADLARSTDLGRATVSDIAANLIGEGLVVEVGRGTSTGGKPPTLLELDPDGRFVVAVDLGTRPFQAALLNLRGRIVTNISGKITAPRDQEAVQELHRMVAELLGAARVPALGIGIGVPGVVDAGGYVVDSAHLVWEGMPLRDQLEDVYGLPTYVAADAEVGAIAEFGRSGLPPESTLVYVKADDRIAVSVIAAGTSHRTPLQGGDLSHLSASTGLQCSCGRTGCLGTIVSVGEILGADAEDLSDEGRRRMAVETAPDLANAARKLGNAVAPLVAGLDADRVVVGGLLAELGAVAAPVALGIEDALGWTVDVISSPLGPSAVVLGAAGQVLSGELGVVWG